MLRTASPELARRSSTRPAASSSRSPGIDGPVPERRPRRLPADAPRRRGHRMDRCVVLLRPAGPGAATAEGGAGRRGRRRGRVLGRPRRAASTTRRSTASRRPRCPSHCTGSSGRRTRPGSPGSRSSSSSTTSTRRSGSSIRRSPTWTSWQAIVLSIGGLALAWIVYDVLCRTVGERSQAALAIVGMALVAARGVGRRGALRTARRVSPGRRDARDNHGRERPARDHPRAPEARPRDGGEARAGPGTAPAGEGAVGSQQLPHAARCSSRCSSATSRSSSGPTRPGSCSCSSPC